MSNPSAALDSGARFRYSTGKTHSGRIDSLGLDENNCPVILEYKRSVGENVINQGLFYLDWLMDHQAEFKLLVMDKLGKPAADAIDWTAPRLVCIAADFTKYDGHAVQQINRNIELIRYRRFGDELLLLELANATSANTSKVMGAKATKPAKAAPAQRAEAICGLQALEEFCDGSAAEESPAVVPAPGPRQSGANAALRAGRQQKRALGHGRRGVGVDVASRFGRSQAADPDGLRGAQLGCSRSPRQRPSRLS